MALLFDTPALQVRDLRAAQLPQLQALFEANPGYFVRVGGQPPRPDEAQQEFDELPPADMAWRQRWFAGVFDRARPPQLQGLLIVVADLCAPQVWHTALFFLADRLHGSGVAGPLHAALQAWAQAGGARWLRLGVVQGNTRAERFWQRCGYQAVRTREITDASGGPRTVSVMVKPLADATLADYLARVPRDRPGSTAP